MSQRIAGAAALFLLASAPALANTSLYTPTSGQTCTTLHEDKEDGGMTDWVCPAPTGFKAFFSAADLYEGVRLARAGQPQRVAASYIGAHGVLGDKLEWRLSPEGVPVAAILRFAVDGYDENGAHESAPKLIVMRITAQGSCVVGRVPAKRPDANEAARELADRVTPNTPCDGDPLSP